MKNKKNVALILGIIVVLFITPVIFSIIKNKDEANIEYESADKYSLSISIDIIKEEGIEPILVNVSYDGTNAKVSSTNVNMESYIIANKLYYLKNNTFYVYEANRSYEDLYQVLNNIRNVDLNREDGGYTYYTALLKVKNLNDILDCLFFSKKSSSETIAKITVKDEMIREFNLSISDIEGYKEININIQIDELDEDYMVDTSRVWGTGSGIIVHNYKRENTRVNVYEIIK